MCLQLSLSPLTPVGLQFVAFCPDFGNCSLSGLEEDGPEGTL